MGDWGIIVFNRPHDRGLGRDLVSGQLPQGEGNWLIFEIRSVKNPHLVPGWGWRRGEGGGLH